MATAAHRRCCHGLGLLGLLLAAPAGAEVLATVQRGLANEASAPHLALQAWQEPVLDGSGQRQQEARLMLESPGRAMALGVALSRREAADGWSAPLPAGAGTPAARVVWQWRLGERRDVDAAETRGLRLEIRPQHNVGMSLRGSTLRWQMDASASLALKVSGGGARVTWQQAW